MVIKPGTAVIVEHRGRMKEGVVKQIMGAMARVEFAEGEALVPLVKVTPDGGERAKAEDLN